MNRIDIYRQAIKRTFAARSKARDQYCVQRKQKSRTGDHGWALAMVAP